MFYVKGSVLWYQIKRKVWRKCYPGPTLSALGKGTSRQTKIVIVCERTEEINFYLNFLLKQVLFLLPLQTLPALLGGLELHWCNDFVISTIKPIQYASVSPFTCTVQLAIVTVATGYVIRLLSSNTGTDGKWIYWPKGLPPLQWEVIYTMSACYY